MSNLNQFQTYTAGRNNEIKCNQIPNRIVNLVNLIV